MKESVEYFLFRLLRTVAGRLSYRQTASVGGALGSFIWFLGIRKRITLDNLVKAFPEKSPAEIRAIARGAYRNYGIGITQMSWAGGAREEELRTKVHVPDLAPIEQSLARGKGLILLSAHFGSWELLVNSLRLNIGRPYTMIVQTQRNKKINAFLDTVRSRFGNTTVPMGPSVRQIMKALQQGGIVLILGDQSGAKEAIFVDFFGRPSATHRGAAAFSLKNDTPIVMALLSRRADGTYEALFEEIDRTGLTGYNEKNVLELTRRHTHVLEKYIRRYPDHWLWMHKRWKHTAYFESHREELTGSGRLEEKPS